MQEDNRCSLPFTGHFQLNVDRNMVSPCCKVRASAVIDGNLVTADAIEIRKYIVENKQHPLCSECWKVEENGGPSFRTRYSSHNKINWKTVDVYSQPKKIIFIFSNKCQMMCIYCGPDASSMWEMHKGIIPIRQVHDKLNIDLDGLDGISISGGEPLLEDKCIDFLMNLEFRKNRDISLVTNLSYGPATLRKLLQIIERHPNISIGCSIDAIGENVSRKYLNWELWNSNFHNLVQQLQERLPSYPKASVYTKSTLGILNYKDIQGVVEYILGFRKSGNTGITFDINPLTSDSVTSLGSASIDNSRQIILDSNMAALLTGKEANLIYLTNKMIQDSVYDN